MGFLFCNLQIKCLSLLSELPRLMSPHVDQSTDCANAACTASDLLVLPMGLGHTAAAQVSIVLNGQLMKLLFPSGIERGIWKGGKKGLQ